MEAKGAEAAKEEAVVLAVSCLDCRQHLTWSQRTARKHIQTFKVARHRTAGQDPMAVHQEAQAATAATAGLVATLAATVSKETVAKAAMGPGAQ
jgi:hypothetical protein